MSDRISTLQLFCTVSRTGSFTAAGQEIGLSQPSVSRLISNLEKELGAALFVRSTHAVNLTEAGAEYLERIEPLLAALEEANHLVRGDGTLRGRLRVGSATSFATRELMPHLPEFLLENPNLQLDLVLTDSFQDLIDQSIDVALRVGPLSNSTMISHKLAEAPRLLAASPAYLEQAGVPETPSDLAMHRVILGPSSTGSTGWRFKKEGDEIIVQPERQLMVTVNEASTSAALEGIGIISTSLLGCRAEIENGDLIRLLPDWDMGSVEVHAVITAGSNAKPSATAFVEHTISSFKKNQHSVMA
ncbi:MAG: LysR family transcriptional regulator [Chloroflexota bacterium]